VKNEEMTINIKLIITIFIDLWWRLVYFLYLYKFNYIMENPIIAQAYISILTNIVNL